MAYGKRKIKIIIVRINDWLFKSRRKRASEAVRRETIMNEEVQKIIDKF